MPENFDVIIVGLGAMGSAAAYHLAKQGKRVLGLDRFSPPHTFGSSHGETRIIREAYFEHPLYVPLVQRAYELWADLERASGQRLFVQTGGLMIGRAEGVVVGGAKRSAEQHHLQHEMLSSAEVRRRFPGLQPAEEMVAVWEPRAGILFPERCIEAHLSLARQHGATLLADAPVVKWQPNGDGVSVFTAKAELSATYLVLSAGAWLTSLVPDLKLPLTVERQMLFWFEPGAERNLFHPSSCPIHLWEWTAGRFFYGFPDLGTGVKIARHHEGEITAPDNACREVKPEEVAAMRNIILRKFLPKAADGLLRNATVCLYTNTPDGHFLIDHHPSHPQVLIASPCSGHGFKFSSAIGEVLADLITQGQSRFDPSLFRNRFC